MKHAPVLIQIYEGEIQKADLIKELKIDRHNIDREILRQPGKYFWWSAVYAKVSEKVDALQEQLEQLEAKLANKYVQRLREKKQRYKVSDVKYFIAGDSEHRHLRRKLRHWQNSERILKFAERGFTQRASMLQSYAANTRRERKAADDD
jgi:nucleotidyltransferase/DNA polymerase involved in DNA repair